MMIVADKDVSLLLSGTGDVIESDDGILAIGSGGPYANSAAKALINNTKMNLIADEVKIVKRLKSRIFNTQKITIRDVENFNSWIIKTLILLGLLKLVNRSR